MYGFLADILTLSTRIIDFSPPMESSEHKEGFENFLKEKADSYKMYPSEKVWNSLNDRLHPRKKWPYLAMAVIFLGLGFGGKIFDTRYNAQDSGLISSSKISLDDQQSPEIKNEPASEGQALVIDIRQQVKSKAAGQLPSSGSHLQETAKSSIETGALIYTSPLDDENGHFSNAFREKLNAPPGHRWSEIPSWQYSRQYTGSFADNQAIKRVQMQVQWQSLPSRPRNHPGMRLMQSLCQIRPPLQQTREKLIWRRIT